MGNFDKTSEGLITYDPDQPGNNLSLLTADHLEAFELVCMPVVRKETRCQWEVSVLDEL